MKAIMTKILQNLKHIYNTILDRLADKTITILDSRGNENYASAR